MSAGHKLSCLLDFCIFVQVSLGSKFSVVLVRLSFVIVVFLVFFYSRVFSTKPADWLGRASQSWLYLHQRAGHKCCSLLPWLMSESVDQQSGWQSSRWLRDWLVNGGAVYRLLLYCREIEYAMLRIATSMHWRNCRQLDMKMPLILPASIFMPSFKSIWCWTYRDVNANWM